MAACIALMLSIVTQTPQNTRWQIEDQWGRSVAERGMTLVDWEGQIANPVVKLKVKLPSETTFPATLYVHGTSPRLHFNRADSDDRSGIGRRISIPKPVESVEFFTSIFPDRDNQDEKHELVLQLFGPDRLEQKRTRVKVQVIDQDRAEWKPLYPIHIDYSYDKTGYFKNLDVQRVLRQAADDWAYFIDQKSDTVPIGAEPSLIWNPDGFVTSFKVTNKRPYSGYLMYISGIVHEENRAGGSPSLIGKAHSLNGKELPIRRSGSVEFDVTGNWNRMGWFLTRGDEDWWVSGNLRGEPSDLYSIALHEMGHALAFEGTYPAYGRAKAGQGLASAALLAYLGFAPKIDASDHLINTIDPVSHYGAYGREYDGDMKERRWLLTKTHLLCLEAIGYKVRRTAAFEPMRVFGGDLLLKRGERASGGFRVSGGIPEYHFRVASGALPPGCSLDSYSGQILGSPSEAGAFKVTVEADDNDPTTPAQKSQLGMTVR